MSARVPSWLLLVLSLPSGNASGRMRYWRALKGLGSGSLRDGVYVMPASAAHRAALRSLADEIIEGGGAAHVVAAASDDAEQEAAFRQLFDRTEEYAEFQRSLLEARRGLSKATIGELSRLQQRLRRDYDALKAIDYFPGDSSAKAETAWLDLESRLRARIAPDEPHAASRAIARLDRSQYRGRLWATRERLWVDRVASAWLIRRFIDPSARFVWLKTARDCPKKALGFDFDGAAFTHVDDKVTFEVLMLSFALEEDAALRRLGELVHVLDVGEGQVPEAAGFEALMSAARKRQSDDDALLEEMSPILDGLYQYFDQSNEKGKSK